MGAALGPIGGLLDRERDGDGPAFQLGSLLQLPSGSDGQARCAGEDGGGMCGDQPLARSTGRCRCEARRPTRRRAAGRGGRAWGRSSRERTSRSGLGGVWYEDWQCRQELDRQRRLTSLRVDHAIGAGRSRSRRVRPGRGPCHGAGGCQRLAEGRRGVRRHGHSSMSLKSRADCADDDRSRPRFGRGGIGRIRSRPRGAITLRCSRFCRRRPWLVPNPSPNRSRSPWACSVHFRVKRTSYPRLAPGFRAR